MSKRKFNNYEEFEAWLGNTLPEEIYLRKNNPRYVEVMQAAYTISELATEANENFELIIRPDELAGTAITVEITTGVLVFEDMPKLSAALAKANSMEFCTKINDTSILAVCFNGAFKPAKPQQ